MESLGNNMGKIRNRYITAIAIFVLFVAALLLLANFIVYTVIDYVPGLTPYTFYVTDATYAIIELVGAFMIYRILISIVTLGSERRHDVSNSEVVKLVLRVLFYALAIAIVLAAFGISPTDALAGGAVGGIVIGLAAQTILSSILSGFLLSSSKTMVPGEVVIVRSGTWGSTDIFGKVARVNILYTDIVNQNGNVMRFPNPVMLSSTILTRLKTFPDGSFEYPLYVTLSPDAPAEVVRSKAQAILKAEFKKIGMLTPAVMLYSKNPANVFMVLVHSNLFDNLDGIQDTVNMAFDKAYWGARR
ncbi:MAG: mechanosensitive ion channel family protein [Candidatus Micrarchaeota archaeon]|nr:mechanosensitive ion channel family protein [Candidatus Micrarchaeota archaeon]